MERKFTTAARLVLDIQQILRKNPSAVATLERDQKRRQLVFRCEGFFWVVRVVKAQQIAPTDFRALFWAQDSTMEAINKRVCLKPWGLKDCNCGDDNLHVVDDVLNS